MSASSPSVAPQSFAVFIPVVFAIAVEFAIRVAIAFAVALDGPSAAPHPCGSTTTVAARTGSVGNGSYSCPHR